MDPLPVAKGAARGFGKLQCDECAHNIRSALVRVGQRGQLVEIRDAGGRDFMICLSYDGGQTTITQNGRHVGVRVGDVMLDNLHPNGVPFDDWLRDFQSIHGVAITSTQDF